MIAKLLLATVPLFIVLVVSEILWRKKILKGERARKFIHILAGIHVAFWPLYLPFDGIFVLGAMALTLLIYSRFTRLFHAVYAVKRTTYGELFYAIAIMACAYLGQADWIFTTSLLFLAVADGGAAVAGRFWGSSNHYQVFRSKNLTKSWVGTLTFLLLAYVCLAIGWLSGGGTVLADNLFICFVVLPFAATVIENISPFGTDNLITPVFVTVLLSSLL